MIVLVCSKDLGSALIFFVVYVLMVFVASGKFIYLLAGGLGGSVAAYIAFKVFTHVQVRVQAWQDPWSVIDSTGYQITQSLFAISSGGLFGLGLFKGTPDSIPFVEADFVFSAIAEELGILFAVCPLHVCGTPGESCPEGGKHDVVALMELFLVVHQTERHACRRRVAVASDVDHDTFHGNLQTVDYGLDDAKVGLVGEHPIDVFAL